MAAEDEITSKTPASVVARIQTRRAQRRRPRHTGSPNAPRATLRTLGTMAQRTIASFFGASPASAPLADATNSNQLGKVASVPFGAPEKRPAPDHDARAAPPSKRVAAPRPFTKGADVVPVPDTTGARPDLVQLCNVDGREYLLNEAVWSCDNLTKPVARWREGPAAKFHVIAGTRGLVAVFSGALLRVYRVPNVDAPPLASACLRCAAAGSGAESPAGCECAGAAPGNFGDADAVHRVASFPAPSTRGEGATETKTKDGIVTPNLAVLTKGGRLRLLLVSDSNSDNDPRANVAAAFASLGPGASSLIEGAFAYAFPDVPRGERFARPFVFWRDPEDDAKANGRSFVVAGSSSTGSLCVASCDVAAGVRLDRVVTPHLDPAVHDAALWLGAPGGASVVTVGGDGNVAVSHLRARAASEDSAFAATAKPDRAAHVVAVCERTGFALVGSRDEDELSVWDLRDERRVRKVRLFAEGGRSSTAGNGLGATAMASSGKIAAAAGARKESGLRLVRGR